jgi:spore germination cell wall hydrolase CwlJ-like protein
MMTPMSPQRMTAVALAAALAACAGGGQAPAPAAPRTKALATLAGAFSQGGAARVWRQMAPGMRLLVGRLQAGPGADFAGRMQGWAVLDVTTAPSLGFAALSPDEAERLNALLPQEGEPPAPAEPFVLEASAAERERAILCLTEAIYYEAALQPTVGQEAVAQAVINRMRHPAFPKSICGVVYQGAQAPGCQFSFACDGSRDRAPAALFWARARAVAVQALDGFVMRAVGLATHYHADYVFPRWGPTLVKIRQIGAHIFYRFPGPAGAPGAFQDRYGGGELRVSMAGPSPEAILAAKAAGAPSEGTAGPIESFTMVDPTSPTGLRQRVAGQVIFGRRVPTPEEIAKINASLAGLDATPAKPASPAPAAAKPAPPVIKVPSPAAKAAATKAPTTSVAPAPAAPVPPKL